MKKKQSFFHKITGLSPFIWTIFGILPFYFIVQSTSRNHIVLGILCTILFFIFYRFAFISRGRSIYIWTFLLIALSVTLTFLFNYIYFAFYFAFFIAYFIGNIEKRSTFLILYIVHLVITVISVNVNVAIQAEVFLRQLPFIFVISLSVVVLPFSIFNRKKSGLLEEKLQDANQRIAELSKHEERQRIARDLHDTLGQKLSLIGLKSDLARKLVYKDPEQAKSELKDVQQTARTALNEVRKMVSQMRGIRLDDELIHVQQILKAAEIELNVVKKTTLSSVSLFVENILSMCVKESVTNIVKHSKATSCTITLAQSVKEVQIIICDDGIGIEDEHFRSRGHGFQGMQERLQFVNGTLDVRTENGTTLIIKVPNVLTHVKEVEK